MKIKICSLAYAAKELSTGKYTALISIGHPDGSEHVEGPAPATRLDLHIGDVTPFRYGRYKFPLMTGEQAVELIEFARGLRPETSLLIHCKKGRSRSTATALIVQVARGASESQALKDMLAGCPKANPNGWMLTLADAIMRTKLFGYCHRAGCLKWKLAREEAAAE